MLSVIKALSLVFLAALCMFSLTEGAAVGIEPAVRAEKRKEECLDIQILVCCRLPDGTVVVENSPCLCRNRGGKVVSFDISQCSV